MEGNREKKKDRELIKTEKKERKKQTNEHQK